ncbi:MAG: DUF4178 domain-containing protein [Gemmatimonas sp.]
MTSPAPRTAACPNCGAAIRFLWSQAVQTTCTYCKAVLVRRDLDLDLVGRQANFPETGSPIQIGTEGKWRGSTFQVVGRIAYSWSRGRWNEWYCRVSDGTSAWLSDAQLEYAMTVAVKPSGPLPDADAVRVGDTFIWDDHAYDVSTITQASYLGTEGELPFTSFTREQCLFVDLQNDSGQLATVDFSDHPAVLYLGEYADFDTFAFTHLREFEGW